MPQYMIIYGPIGLDENETTPVSVSAVGDSMTIKGPAKSVAKWADILGSSLILAGSFKDGEPQFGSYAAGNSMTDILVFTDEEYDAHKERFEAIKGASRVIKLTRVPTIDDDDFSQNAVNKFLRRNASKAE